MDNDRIGQISPLDRIQRVEPSGQRDGKRKKRKSPRRPDPDREPTEGKKTPDPPSDEAKGDDEDPPTKGSRLDVRA